MIVSIILLAVISFGVASAAENVTADEIAVDGGDIELEAPVNEEITADGDNLTDVAVSDNEKLGVSEDDELSVGTVTPTYTIEVTPDTMSGSTYVAQYGQRIVVNGTFENATGTVDVRFGYSGNYQYFTVPLVDGKFSQDLTKYTVRNNYQIQVTYSGDDYYKGATWSKNIHIQANDIVANGADYGQIAFVNVNLYDATGNVTFTVNGKTYKIELVNGTAIQEFTDYVLGTNSVSFAYEGDDEFNALSRSLSFKTTANVDAPTIYNYQPAIITAYLGDATGNVNFTFGDATQIVEIVNGVATFEAAGYAIGENTVSIAYSGDDTFNPFTTTQKFTVLNKEDANIYSSVYKTANKNMVIICIPYATGNVNVTINGKKEVLELVDGIAYYNISATDEINEVNVSYAGNTRLNPGESSKFIIMDNVVTGDTYMYYFNQADGGNLFDFIEAGSTLDFQGAIINPDTTNEMNIVINKPMNVISSTNDAYIDLNTTAGSLLGEHPGSSFVVNRGGSGSNISGIYLHNTELWISNTSHVVFDNISVVVEDQRVGSGVGATSVRDNSSYVTLKNSYFYTRNNGGSTTFTFSWADHCIFDNNTVKAEGNVGNLLYLNVYNIVGAPTGVPLNTYNTFSNNKVYGKEGSAISVGIMVEGIGNIIENNTMFKCSISTSFGGVGPANNSYIGNVLMEGSSLTAQAKSIVYNNIVPGTMNTGANSIAYNNTVGKAMTVGAGSEAYENTVGGLTLSGAGAYVHDNTVNGATTISQANTVVANNTFLGDNSIKFSNANAKNVTFADNDVVGYIEFGNANAKGNIITGNNIATSKDYAIDLKTYANTETVITDNILNSNNGFGNDAINHVDDETLVIDNYQNETASIIVEVSDIKVGETAVFNVTTNQTEITSAEIVVNNKKYAVDLVNGVGSVEVADLLAGTYTVTVTSNDERFGAQNTTSLTVSKNDCPEIAVDAPEKTQWIASDITVTINDATGSVTLSIEGNEVTAELADGVAVLAVPDLTPGEYDFTIAYSGDYKYLDGQTTGTLIVNKNKEVKIIASDVSFDKLATGFSAQFTNYIGEAISGANVTFIIDGQTYNATTDENGVAIVDLALTRGVYPVNIEFKAIEGEYDANTSEATITVIDGTVIDIVSVSGDCVITGSLKDIFGAPIANAVVSYVIDGVETNTTTDANGIFNVQAKNNCNVSMFFKGDALSTPANKTITLSNIAPVAKDVVIEVKNANYVAVDTGAKEKGKMYYFTLKDTDGNNLTNKTVKVSFDGKVYTVTTNASGQAGIRISAAAAKTYNLNVFFMGDDDYKGATALAKINVAKKKTTIMPKKTTFVFKAAAKSKLVTATLRTTNKYLKAGKKVTITINGKTYTAKTLSNGAIKLNINGLTKKGKYSAKIRFAGDSTYKPVYSKFIKIVIQ